MALPVLNSDALKALDLAQIAGQSIAQAIVEDFVIFDLIPKGMKYGTEIAIQIIKEAPEMTEAVLQGEAELIRAPGESLGAAGKALKVLPFTK